VQLFGENDVALYFDALPDQPEISVTALGFA
jgi:hypothetical protein